MKKSTLKKEPFYKERNEVERVAFDCEIYETPPGTDIVYVDECGINKHLSREYGRSKRGKRVCLMTYGRKFKKLNCIGGMVGGKMLAFMKYQGKRIRKLTKTNKPCKIALTGGIQMKTTIIDVLKTVPDYRKGNAILHELSDILMIGLLTMLCGGEKCSDMALFGETHRKQLDGFLELPNGIPSHDTFEDVFSKLNPKILNKTFGSIIDEIKSSLQGATIAIDGKTIRRSKEANKKATHVVTAFASELQLVLGQLSTDEKSNEITAIPELLDLLCVKGNIVTIDAMGAQSEITQKIIDKDGDYLIALKANQPNLHEDVKLHLEKILQEDKEILKKNNLYARTFEKSHGRIETRECYICNYLSSLRNGEKWAGLCGFGVIVSKREELGKEATTSKNYFIYSIKSATAENILKIKREHWAIENNLHWLLDVLFREDECRSRRENSAENLNIIKKQALQLMKQETSITSSLRAKRLRCAYDIFYALLVVGVKLVS